MAQKACSVGGRHHIPISERSGLFNDDANIKCGLQARFLKKIIFVSNQVSIILIANTHLRNSSKARRVQNMYVSGCKGEENLTNWSIEELPGEHNTMMLVNTTTFDLCLFDPPHDATDLNYLWQHLLNWSFIQKSAKSQHDVDITASEGVPRENKVSTFLQSLL